MKDSDLIWFNFGRFGYAVWCPVSPIETNLMLMGAEHFVDSHPAEVCDYMLECKSTSLIHRAAAGRVNPDWISEALLVTAMQGLMGYETPEVCLD